MTAIPVVEEKPINPSKPYTVMPNGGIRFYTTKYRTEMDQIAYDAVAQEDGTLTHACYALGIAKSTLLKWMGRYPSFFEAISRGKEVGEYLFRQKVKEVAFQPTSGVNNTLIKMIARNVHGIDIESEVSININVGNKKELANEDCRLYQEEMENIIEGDYEEVAQIEHNDEDQ